MSSEDLREHQHLVYVDDLTVEETLQEVVASSSDNEAQGNEEDTLGLSHTKQNDITENSSRLLYHAALTFKSVI